MIEIEDCAFNVQKIDQMDSVDSVKVKEWNRILVKFNIPTITHIQFNEIERYCSEIPHVCGINAFKLSVNVEFEV